MYKLFYLLFAISFFAPLQKSFGQRDSTLTQKITSDFCNEFSKKDFSKIKGFEMEIGLMVIPIIEKYSKEIKKEWDLDPENEEDYEKISEKIGREATVGCPEFREFIRNNIDQINEVADDNDTKSISGTFQRLEGQQLFTALVIKTKAGKEEKLWWFQFFEGSGELAKDPASLAKKNLTIKYTEMEVYDAKLKEYRTIKVMKNLAIN
jgi:hypothetical protein